MQCEHTAARTRTEPCKHTAHKHKRCTPSLWTRTLWLTVRLQTQSVSHYRLMFCVFFKMLCSCCEDSAGRTYTRTYRRTHSCNNAQNSRAAASNNTVSDQTKLPRRWLQRQQKNIYIYILSYILDVFVTVPHLVHYCKTFSVSLTRKLAFNIFYLQ